MPPFDAVLVVAFGGPQGRADVRPFLANVLRGRRVSPERVEEVAHHYERFGGVSPLTDLTMRQAAGMRDRLRARGLDLPVYVGMRNWHPYLKDTLAQMSRDGVRRAVGFIAAAQRSYSSCLQYRENVVEARAGLRAAGLHDVEVSYVGDWHTHARFIEAGAAAITDAQKGLGALGDAARVVFTAHSIPVSMAERYPYERQLRETASEVIAALKRRGSFRLKADATGDAGTDAGWDLVYQSRSGRPEDPWLGPDICDHLRDLAARGVTAALLAPIGFICDHIEVLYDIDVEAAETCRAVGLPMVRARTVNDHPAFLEMMADVVAATVVRHRTGRPLPLVAAPR